MLSLTRITFVLFVNNDELKCTYIYVLGGGGGQEFVPSRRENVHSYKPRQFMTNLLLSSAIVVASYDKSSSAYVFSGRGRGRMSCTAKRGRAKCCA